MASQAYFLSNYKSISSSNSDISYRVDIKRKRVYMPKEWQGKRVIISAQGAPKESAQGALVNAQGFASVGKLSSAQVKELARAVDIYNKK